MRRRKQWTFLKVGKCKDVDVIIQGGVVAGSIAAIAGKILLEYLLFLMPPVSEYTHETRGNFQKTFPQYQEETIIIMTTTAAAAAVTILVKKKNSRIQKPRLYMWGVE